MQQPDVVLNNAVVYTDGACDNTRDPYAARAAWAAILRTPTDTQIETENAMWKFKVLAAGHCPGHQTISRSELYAMVIAVELIATEPSASHVRFVTDSQYVVNCIHQIEDETIFACPNKKRHWDLIQLLVIAWNPVNFTVLKIKSHQDITQANKHRGGMAHSWE